MLFQLLWALVFCAKRPRYPSGLDDDLVDTESLAKRGRVSEAVAPQVQAGVKPYSIAELSSNMKKLKINHPQLFHCYLGRYHNALVESRLSQANRGLQNLVLDMEVDLRSAELGRVPSNCQRSETELVTVSEILNGIGMDRLMIHSQKLATLYPGYSQMISGAYYEIDTLAQMARHDSRHVNILEQALGQYIGQMQAHLERMV